MIFCSEIHNIVVISIGDYIRNITICRNICILELENEFQSSKVRYEMPNNFKHQQTEANLRP